MLTYYVNQTLWLSLALSAPVVITAMVLGLILGLLQAVFQLQDQALPFAIKLVCVTLVLYAVGPWLASMLIQFTVGIFELISSSETTSW